METEKKILLVEDEIITALFLTSQLRRMGFTVPSVPATGEQAVLLAGTERPDLILMDINLAGMMDGITAAGKIRENRTVPVIFLTGYSDGEIIARAKEQKPANILSKPVDLKILEKEIRSALGALRE
jgi:CheY-like chemotaxis protein